MAVILQAGLKLDALIAEKVMGWTRLEDGNFVQPDTDGWRRGLDVARWEEDRGSFNPSTDIAAAWEVVERGHWFLPFSLLPFNGGWAIARSNHFDGSDEAWIYAEAPTAPLAICLAALRAVGKNND